MFLFKNINLMRQALVAPFSPYHALHIPCLCHPNIQTITFGINKRQRHTPSVTPRKFRVGLEMRLTITMEINYFISWFWRVLHVCCVSVFGASVLLCLLIC